MKSTTLKAMIAMAVITATVFFGELVGAQCPFTGLTSAKTKLYLYFATGSDATFPEYDDDLQTSPLEPFNVSDLDGGIGTTAQLRNSIIEIVKEDYCEFDVEVASTTTAPSPAEARWQIVGLGSDDEFDPLGNEVFGVAQDVDLNNNDQQDYARVYAKSFLNAYGGAGDALNGANSTLARWATAIGHTVVHESGHNFGLSHNNSAARTGEDGQNSHIMATGSTGLTGETRAGTNRHFGDQEYEILGHNIGLKVKTLYNWDFINPNAEEAHSLVLTLLSPASTLTLNWFWNGSTSPWTSPTVASAGTQSFQGTTYKKYTLTFSTAKAWSGGSNGVVPGGAEFHIGATFAEPDLVIVFETRLKNSGGTNLNLHPRLASFDTGDTDLGTGDFNVRAFNADAGNALVVEDLRVALLPRLLSIDSMVSGADLRDIHNVPIAARQPGRFFGNARSLEVGESATFRLASFTEARSVDLFYDPTNCKRGFRGSPRQGTPARPTPKPSGSGRGDVSVGELEYCPKGWALSLFPATYVYLTATIVDPNAKYWDKAQGKYVTGPLRSKVFYQFAGKLPDFNKNGVDDLIDIRTNVSKDENKNGIVDESEKGQPTPGPQPHSKKYWWWLLILLLLIFLIWLIWWLRRRRTA
jgi:hypothetical protein